MNRRPVSIAIDSNDASYSIVVCNDGSVFSRNYGHLSNDWTELPPIPGTFTAGTEQEPAPADAALELMRGAFAAALGEKNTVIIHKHPGVDS